MRWAGGSRAAARVATGRRATAPYPARVATNDDLLTELQNIAYLLGDLNFIRNGEYDPPRGADPQAPSRRATLDDVFSRLGSIVGLLERQNEMIYELNERVTRLEP